MNDLLNQYKLVSYEIQNEKESLSDALLSNLFFSEYDDNSFSQHEANLFSLYCLRITINCQLLQVGYHTYFHELEKDLDNAVESAKTIICKMGVTDEVLHCVDDILIMICPECQKQIYSYFDTKYKNKSRKTAEIPQSLYYLAVETSEALKRLDKESESLSLLEGLCQLSKKRNDVERHKNIITNVFTIIADRSPETIIRIAKSSETYFGNSLTDFDGDFFWGYGCALNKLQLRSDAKSSFKKCYDIRKALYGDEDWFTAVAKLEYSLIINIDSNGQRGTDDLLSFINNAENDIFKIDDEKLLRSYEGRALFSLLSVQSSSENIAIYDKQLRIYERLCERFNAGDDPFLKNRLAKNFRGGFYVKTGDYILAEKSFTDALDSSVADGIPVIITDLQIKSNLLMAYYVQNDIEMALPLITELLGALDLDESKSGLTEGDEYRIYSLLFSIQAQNMIEQDEDDKKFLKSLLEKTCNDISDMSSGLSEYPKEFVVFIISAVQLVLQIQCASRDDLKLYLNAMLKIDTESSRFSINQIQRIALKYMAALTAWTIGDSTTNELMNQCITLSENEAMPQMLNAAMSNSAATFLGRSGDNARALSYVDRSLNSLKEIWISCVKYLNDERLIRILITVQVQFAGCYALLRAITDPTACYQRLLQFKAIASLAGKERNRILNSPGVNTDLLGQIKTMQNKISALETSIVFHDVADEYKADRAELRRLEAVFAENFPAADKFTDITLESVYDAIPDNSVVIEYIYTSLAYGQGQFEGSVGTGIDIYVIQKQGGVCKLMRFTVENGEYIIDCADEFVGLLQKTPGNSADMEEINKLESLRKVLYEALIGPTLSYLSVIPTVYIAPDANLINLPFDLLYGDEQERLADNHEVIKIECARDFLYKSSAAPTDGSLIIGNPQFETREPNHSEENPYDTRKYSQHSIRQLPFSEVEVQQISRYYGGHFYTGCAANKKLLMSPNNYGNIHIATHGYFDLDNESNVLYSSCLLFAGAGDWLRTGTASSIYGNGIVTADEISRLNLKSAEYSWCIFRGWSTLCGIQLVGIRRFRHGNINGRILFSIL